MHSYTRFYDYFIEDFYRAGTSYRSLRQTPRSDDSQVNKKLPSDYTRSQIKILSYFQAFTSRLKQAQIEPDNNVHKNKYYYAQ